jgi:hypothetical protein
VRDAHKGSGGRRVTQSVVSTMEFFRLVFVLIASQYETPMMDISKNSGKGLFSLTIS